MLSLLFALNGCSHDPAPSDTMPGEVVERQTGDLMVKESDEEGRNRVVADIIHAKALESGQLSRPAQEPVIIMQEGHTYRYPNLRAFRANIKHRMDSLHRAGVALDFDTLITNPMVSGKLRVTHN